MDFERMRYLMNRLPMALLNVDRALSAGTRTSAKLTGMPRGSGGGSQVENSAILLAIAKERVRAIRGELAGMRQELALRTVELENPLERTVIKLRYMDGMPVREIAYQLGYAEKYMFRVVKSAEANIQKGYSGYSNL